MQYYFSSEKLGIGQYFKITGDDVHHIGTVMRMKVKDVVIITDCQQYRYKCEITNITKKFVEYKVLELVEKYQEEKASITLIYSMVKQDKFEFVLQKACELGVSKIIPYYADFSQIKLDSSKILKKMERWNKILKEASEQSQRFTIPVIEAPIDRKQLLKKEYSGKKLMCVTEAVEKEYLFNVDITGDIVLLVGPEGGFSEAELSDFKRSGFQYIALTNNILRTETAVIYALALIDAKIGSGEYE